MGRWSRRLPAAVSGVAAVVFGAGIGELVAGFVDPQASPVATISDALIDVAPAWAKETAIAWFGTGDKIALVAGVVLVLVAVAALSGLLEARLAPWGRALALAVGAVGAVVAVTRPDSSWLDAVPSVVAGVASALALGALVRRMPWDAASRFRTVVSAWDGRTVRIPRPAALVAASGETAGAAAGVAAAAGAAASGAAASGVPAGVAAASGVAAGAAASGVAASAQSAVSDDGLVEGAVSDGDLVEGAAAEGAVSDGGASAGGASAFLRSDRRRFLAWSGGATLLGLSGAVGGGLLRAKATTEQAARDAVPIPAPAVAAPAVPAGAQLDVPGLFPVVTPNADFYRIDTAIFPPVVSVQDWTLRVHGLVEQEVTIGWNELVSQPLQESHTTLMCVSNEVGGYLAGTARWLGYPIRELLARARPTAEADMVLSTSIDGFTASTPLEALTDGRNAILAVAMNGSALPQEHGFPVRMVVPGLYGYVSATKWVTDLEVTRFDRAEAYWTVRGWSARGPVKLESRIDVPRPARTVPAGDQVVAGVAWQQGVGVSRVEVQIDDEPWRDATLATAISADTWVQWMLPWTAAAGAHTIRCRATNAQGQTQTETEAPPIPDGASGWHTIDVTAQ